MSDLFKVKTGFICDAVRREDSGKLILIGAYTGVIVPIEFPATLVLCCVVIAEILKPGEIESDFEVLLDGKTQVAGTGKLASERAGTSLWPIPNIVLQNITPGMLRFQIREVKKNWQTILDIPIGPS